MTASPIPAERRIYCNRTLNLRSLKAIGYDMDYTLIHYHAEAWEQRAYTHLRTKLVALGWPVEHLRFRPEQVMRGLIIDRELGNLVKANRFGYVTRATHGTRPLPFDEQRRRYARTHVSLHDDRWEFLNTLFSLSEACMFAQLVDLLDEDRLPGHMNYDDVFRIVHRAIDEAHMEGLLKADILASPETYVDLDPDTPRALLDQKIAGRKLLLITNSEWPYTREIMAFAFDRFLPDGTTWRDLFDLVIVSARKPAFFHPRQPLFRVADEERGLLEPCFSFAEGAVHQGGDASSVEQFLGVGGDEILYVGDHIFTDVNVSKNLLRWRTALVIRELEGDITAQRQFEAHQERLSDGMHRKAACEAELAQARLRLCRIEAEPDPADRDEVREHIHRLRSEIDAIDAEIAPLAQAAATLFHPEWGLLLRAGNDKSHLARQLERHADIYMSRVSNFLHATPFAFLRSPRGFLPHDESLRHSDPDDVSQTVDQG
ncbi:MAG: HAD family hydrolase [Deltaproteobacteria bacterium]|nr:MAG: HAD family hydrolase [Deltaproteobacteria bacterium]